MRPVTLLPLFLPALLCFPLATRAADAAAPRKPNVIVILADDLGYADVGAQGQVKDVRTPHLDRLAAEGVRCTAGYITAPQCSPSRAGLLTGRYQQRFGLDTIPDNPLPLAEVTLAERLKPAGYVSGMVGKWHLDPNPKSDRWIGENLPPQPAGAKRKDVQIPESARLAYSPAGQGFDEFYRGEIDRYWANFDLAGKDLTRGGEWVKAGDRYRLDVQSDAAVAFVDRHHAKPFFLYVAYYAPHTPLAATKAYLDRFPGEMPERRRHALAMTAAMDDGVGQIVAVLRRHQIDDDTLVLFTSDNGAPLKMTKPDTLPVESDPGGWDGSLNDPWVGEKGMLAEGGVRVPFLLWRPGTLPAGKVYDEPVSALDLAATATAAAGLPPDPALDGVNLAPYLRGEKLGAPHEALYWRFWTQAAVRAGRWKYLRLSGEREFLFDLGSDAHERKNVLADHPDEAARLKAKLEAWTRNLQPPGLPAGRLNGQERQWYQFYFPTADAAATGSGTR